VVHHYHSILHNYKFELVVTAGVWIIILFVNFCTMLYVVLLEKISSLELWLLLIAHTIIHLG